MDYVITVQSSCYHTNRSKEDGTLDPNFSDVIVYKDTTKGEVEKIGEDLFKYCRCFWNVMEYNEALKEYEERVYVDPETKQFKWGQYLDVKDALVSIQHGELVGCKTSNSLTLFEDGKVPDYISSEAILKGTWRTIRPVGGK